MVRKFVQRLVSVLLAMLLLIQSAVVSVLAKESRGDQKPVDPILAYFVDAGDQNPTTINDGEMYGVYNSVTDQEYGEDAVTGKTWGVNSQTDRDAMRDYQDGMDKKLSYRCGSTGYNVSYRFELPAGTYDLEIGIPHYFAEWGQRVVNVTAKEGENTKTLATEIKTQDIPEGEATLVEDSVVTTGGELELLFTKFEDGNWDPIVAYIKIYDRNAAMERLDEVKKEAGTYSRDQYTEESYGDLQAALQAAELLTVDNATTAQISAAADQLEAAIKGLVKKDVEVREGTDPAIAYFVDAGSYDPSQTAEGDLFGTLNSVTDQEYGQDSVTGYAWGYFGETVRFSGTKPGMTKEQSCRFGDTGWDIGYKFALDKGEYDVELYVPKEDYRRVFDVLKTDKNGQEKIGYAEAANGPYTFYTKLEMDGGSEAVIDFKKPDGSYWDPVVSYIIIYDNAAAEDAFHALIAEAEKYREEDLKEESYQNLQAAIAAAKQVNPAEMEYPGRDLHAEISKLQQVIDNLLDKDTYNLTFQANDRTGGKLPTGGFLAANKVYTIPESNLTRTGYRFAGWSYSGNVYQAGQEFTMPQADVEFTAVWNKLYTVSFGRNGGSGQLPEAYQDIEGTKISIPESALRRSGYIFAGWSDGSKTYQPGEEYTIAKENKVLNAVWEETKKYSLSFESPEGTGTLPRTMYSEEGELVIIPDCSLAREGYTFTGWSDGEIQYQPGTSLRMPANDLVFTAQWEKKESPKPPEPTPPEPTPPTPQIKYYTVKFASSGNAAIADQQIKEGEKASEPKAPSRKGYLFDGWYQGSQKYNFTAAVNTDLTLTSKWTRVKTAKAMKPSVKNKKGRKAVVSIKKTKGAKGYQILYTTDKRFKKGKKQVLTVKTKRIISKLKKGKTYYFKVRAYKMDSTGQKVFGTYSKVAKLRIVR
ncbi:MAG: InlB B-repeat-containing protein [Lachnospiraceae bacterium]|jgi:uncharacterized repeat protein (TIGR02543 family)|nr:InlB B-repeat-containing protein [Lachnospiraceae bacterium]